MDNALLGKILATVVLAAADLGAITVDPSGVASNPQEIGGIVSGFLELWLPHAKAKVTQAAPIKVGE